MTLVEMTLREVNAGFDQKRYQCTNYGQMAPVGACLKLLLAGHVRRERWGHGFEPVGGVAGRRGGPRNRSGRGVTRNLARAHLRAFLAVARELGSQQAAPRPGDACSSSSHLHRPP